MKYATGQTAAVGDVVDLDGLTGTVVCDFDRRRFAVGYGDWDHAPVDMDDEGPLSSGVMILKVDAGLVHCGDDDRLELIRGAVP